MTFKQWLTEYYADKDSLDGGGYESEYSGDLAGLEDAWNAGVNACMDIATSEMATDAVQDSEYSTAENACVHIVENISELESNEFRNRFEGNEIAEPSEDATPEDRGPLVQEVYEESDDQQHWTPCSVDSNGRWFPVKRYYRARRVPVEQEQP